MLIKTILNRIEKQPGFIYDQCKLRQNGRLTLEITLRPKRGNRPICSGCGRQGPGYDTLAQRRFEFVPLWGIMAFFLYRAYSSDSGQPFQSDSGQGFRWEAGQGFR